MSQSKAHKKRRKKGCWVCGQRFIKNALLPTAQRNTCAECLTDRMLIGGSHRPDQDFIVIVDGSFLAMSGERHVSEPGFGGAGLVLIDSQNEVVGCRACGFAADHSADAEFQAIVRGARWIPEVSIFTDSQSHAARARGELSRDIRFISKKARSSHYELAHQLSVEGRLRFKAWFIEHPENSDDEAGEVEGHPGESTESPA